MKSPQINRLLVVDDDPGFLEMVKEAFSHLNDYKITTVEDPIQAVSEMKRQDFPVVLLDYNLPTLNGNDLISALQGINPHSKFIILSGMGGSEIEEKFKGLGYYCYFEKGSIQVQCLREKVQEAFDLAG